MRKILLDIVPVVVGILLALFINQWQQTRSDRNFIRKSLEAIVAQNKLNVQELTYALARQDQLIDSLKYYIRDPEVMLFDVVSKANGLYTPDLQSTTWKFLLENNNHTLVPYTYIKSLSKIEKYEELIDRHNANIIGHFHDPQVLKDPAFKELLYRNLHDLRNVERDLISAFQEMDSLSLL